MLDARSMRESTEGHSIIRSMALRFYTHYMRAETMKVIMFDIAYKAITATFLDVCGLNVVIIDILPAAAVTPAFI